jgi:hypothetical protein
MRRYKPGRGCCTSSSGGGNILDCCASRFAPGGFNLITVHASVTLSCDTCTYAPGGTPHVYGPPISFSKSWTGPLNYFMSGLAGNFVISWGVSGIDGWSSGLLFPPGPFTPEGAAACFSGATIQCGAVGASLVPQTGETLSLGGTIPVGDMTIRCDPFHLHYSGIIPGTPPINVEFEVTE